MIHNVPVYSAGIRLFQTFFFGGGVGDISLDTSWDTNLMPEIQTHILMILQI